MSNLTTMPRIPASVTTVQGLERYAAETGQDFHELLVEDLQGRHSYLVAAVAEVTGLVNPSVRVLHEDAVRRGTDVADVFGEVHRVAAHLAAADRMRGRG